MEPRDARDRKITSDLAAYYSRRASEYESIYRKPERQADLATAASYLQQIFQNKRVLEAACGTGYWTQGIAGAAASVLAVDISREVLQIASSKNYPHNNVEFLQADIFELNARAPFEALFCGFLWSHIRLSALEQFVRALNRQVINNGTVVLMDNRYVPGSSTPIAETDAERNTWQLRQPQDGTTHRVLKNFPSAALLHKMAGISGRKIEVVELDYFWILVYRCEHRGY
ncbi:MAG TPA: class I SAM-dependent methyltransferase [Flavisolibacter sp.]